MSAAPTTDVVVVGAGLAGLVAATTAARAGATVRLFDARTDLGGRGRTAVDQGFHFNEGPHALYKASEGTAILRRLGLRPQGGNPPLTRSRLSIDGQLLRVPPARALLQVVGLLRRLGADRNDPGLVGVSAQEWIEGRVSDPTGRHLAAALVRVSSYSAELTTFSADAAAAQLHAALRGVTYLHQGWGQLVDALTTAAVDAGVTVDHHKVTSVADDDGRWLVTTDEAALPAGAVVLAAGGPATADRLLGGAGASVATAVETALPVHAACLDLGLRGLPRPGVRFVLGGDRATYASIHTPGAHLAPEGDHVVHLMHYEPGPAVDTAALESLADELQPGWRAHEVTRQVGARRVVAFDRPQVGSGLRGRHGIEVTGLRGVFVAGDWVGPDDLIGGAAIASGHHAGAAAAAAASSPRRERTVA